MRPLRVVAVAWLFALVFPEWWFLATAQAVEPVRALVFCAPGFPGSTAQAAATMTSFAGVVARTAGLPDGSVAAEYHESEEAGLARIGRADAVLALVTLPFYAKHRDAAGLTPRRKAVGGTGGDEVFGLVAKRGALKTPADLEGWEIAGIPGYAPAFVRTTILAGWGNVSETVPIRFTSRVSSALIRAAEGDKLAVLVDGEQLTALATHPRAAELEVVARSKPFPGSLVCEIGAGSSEGRAKALLAALDKLPRSEGGAAALASLRLKRFERVDAARLDTDLGLSPRRVAGRQ